MLSSASRHYSQLHHWLKPSGVELSHFFTVGAQYTEDHRVAPGQMNTRVRPSGFVISTSSLIESLHRAACTVVSHTVPKNFHALVRQTDITHTEPVTIGEWMRVNLRVKGVQKNAICFDIDVVKGRGAKVAASGRLQIGVIKAEPN
jgi:predicted thioesterase